MEFQTGEALVKDGIYGSQIQTWADLGAGDGFFTKVLASLLKEKSLIYAIDQSSSVKNISDTRCTIQVIQSDFSFPPDQVAVLDGVLMGNALHFVREKIEFLERWKTKLKPGGRFLLVEYDTDSANQWVPYPVSKESLRKMAVQIGAEMAIIGETPSRYQGSMYAAVVSPKKS